MGPAHWKKRIWFSMTLLFDIMIFNASGSCGSIQFHDMRRVVILLQCLPSGGHWLRCVMVMCLWPTVFSSAYFFEPSSASHCSPHSLSQTSVSKSTQRYGKGSCLTVVCKPWCQQSAVGWWSLSHSASVLYCDAPPPTHTSSSNPQSMVNHNYLCFIIFLKDMQMGTSH